MTPSLAGDGVGAGSGDAVLRKLVRGGLQDGGAALLRLAARAHAVMQNVTVIEAGGPSGHLDHLINQLVRLYTITIDSKLFFCPTARKLRLQIKFATATSDRRLRVLIAVSAVILTSKGELL